MADGYEIAEKTVDVLSEVFQLRATFPQIANIIKFSGVLASGFPVVGAILGLIGALIPESDVKHQEILRGFKELGNKIDGVRDDIQVLKNVIRWDITELEYGDDVDRIELGMEYCLEIGKRSGQDEKLRYQEKLKGLCANENCALALDAILDGMIGKGIFRSSSILDKFYDKTEGDRPRISALATRLLQVVCGGMMVMSTYETMIHGKEGAADVSNAFYRRLNETTGKVQSVLDRCVEKVKDNMRNDLMKKLHEGGSNEVLVTEIRDLMRDKYDWLENYVLVYNELQGRDKHHFGGIDFVDAPHLNGKCAIVFYRTKGKPTKFTNRYHEAYQIVNVRAPENAEIGYYSIVGQIKARGIGFSGCAVIKNKPDLRRGGTFSSMIIVYVSRSDQYGFWFGKRTETAETILLLE